MARRAYAFPPLFDAYTPFGVSFWAILISGLLPAGAGVTPLRISSALIGFPSTALLASSSWCRVTPFSSIPAKSPRLRE